MFAVIYNTSSSKQFAEVRQAVLDALHDQDIHQSRWSWQRSESPIEVTDDNGNDIDEEPIFVQLPNVESVRNAVENSTMQDQLSELGIIVFTVMAPVEVSIGGKRM